MTGRALSGAYYLRRNGEDYAYLSNVTRPCLRRREWIVVSGKEYDAPGGAKLSPKIVRRRMHRIIKKLGYEIVREQKIHMSMDPTPYKENIYIIKPAQGSPANAATVRTPTMAIRQFAAEAHVEFAGPAILYRQHHDVVSLFPRVEAYFPADIDIDAVKQRLVAAGFNFARGQNPRRLSKLYVYRLRMSHGDLAHYNTMLDKLAAMPRLVELYAHPFAWDR